MLEVKLIGKPLKVLVPEEKICEAVILKLDYTMEMITADEYNRKILALGNF